MQRAKRRNKITVSNLKEKWYTGGSCQNRDMSSTFGRNCLVLFREETIDVGFDGRHLVDDFGARCTLL